MGETARVAKFFDPISNGFERLITQIGKNIYKEREQIMNIKDKIEKIITNYSVADVSKGASEAAENHRKSFNLLYFQGHLATFSSFISRIRV